MFIQNGDYTCFLLHSESSSPPTYIYYICYCYFSALPVVTFLYTYICFKIRILLSTKGEKHKSQQQSQTDMRQYTPDISPIFDYCDVLLDIMVGGAAAAALNKHFRASRQGKRAGALKKLKQHRFRMALPSIHLANLRSLPNKTL